MKVTRIYAGSDGETHFKDIEVSLKEKEKSDLRSEFIKTAGIIFRETTGEYDLDFHNAPRRQYVVTLIGQVDITASDGTTRRFGPGDIMLAEDVTGKGHISRAVNHQPRTCIFIVL